MTANHGDTALGPWTFALFVGVVGCLLWTPLAFGAVEEWSQGLLRLSILALAVIWVSGMAVRGVLVVSTSGLQGVMLAAVTLVLAQLAPVGEGGQPVTADVFSTQQAAISLFLYLVFFSACLASLDRVSRLRQASMILFWFGFSLSLLALIQHLSNASGIYWLRPTTTGKFFGPFANRNHFAGLMEVLLPFGLAPLVTGSLAAERRVLMGFAVVIVGVGLVLSGSRGGLMALVAQIAFLAACVAGSSARRSRSRRGQLGAASAAGLVAILAIGVGVFWVGADPVIDRLSDLPDEAESLSSTSRNAIWRDTMIMVREHPAFGIGAGAYGVAFRRYTQSPGNAVVLHAHNDYLQVLADSGIIGGLLVILFVFVLGTDVLRGLRTRNRELRAIIIGAATGCFGLAVHSFFDFNLQIPSNVLAFLFASAIVARSTFLDDEGPRSFKEAPGHAAGNDTA